MMEKGKRSEWMTIEELLTRYTTALTEKLEKNMGNKSISEITMHPEDFMAHVYDFSESVYLTVSNGL